MGRDASIIDEQPDQPDPTKSNATYGVIHHMQHDKQRPIPVENENESEDRLGADFNMFPDSEPVLQLGSAIDNPFHAWSDAMQSIVSP